MSWTSLNYPSTTYSGSLGCQSLILRSELPEAGDMVLRQLADMEGAAGARPPGLARCGCRLVAVCKPPSHE